LRDEFIFGEDWRVEPDEPLCPFDQNRLDVHMKGHHLAICRLKDAFFKAGVSFPLDFRKDPVIHAATARMRFTPRALSITANHRAFSLEPAGTLPPSPVER